MLTNIRLDYFISKSGYNTFLQLIIATFGSHVKQVIDGKEVPPAVFEVAIDFVGIIFGRLSSEVKEGEGLLNSLLPDMFLFGYLLPLCDRTAGLEDLEGSDDISHSYEAAKGLWEAWIKNAKEGAKGEIVGMINLRLKAFIEDVHIHPLSVSFFLITRVFTESHASQSRGCSLHAISQSSRYSC
jgi:E3 ubiquitin-protein ligase listerin